MSNEVKVAKRVIGESESESQQYLTFYLSGEMYAIGILHIKEIIEYGNLTIVPMMPAFIRGVINLRGSVVPVIDLAARFGRAPLSVTRRSCIVIVEMLVEEVHYDIGVVVDSVSAVLEIHASDIEPPPVFGAQIRTDFIKGMGKVNNRFVIVLDVASVLSVGEMCQLADASSLGMKSEKMVP